MTDGTWIYATGALGGDGCIGPDGMSAGCYRLAISRAKQPLEQMVFNSDILPSSELPANPLSYGFFFKDQQGAYMFMGAFGQQNEDSSSLFYFLNVDPVNLPQYHATELAFPMP